MENRELLKLISVLLQYPSEELIEAAKEYDELIDIEHTDEEMNQKLKRFLEHFNHRSLEELQETYVRTFDFNENTNLYLTYSKLKDEKARGEILVKLKRIYEDEGLIMETDELPDFLPLFLEFLAMAKIETTKQLFTQLREPLENIRNGLIEMNSPYSELMGICLMIEEEYSR